MEESPKNLMNAETLQMLAEWWANPKTREYFINSRVQQVWALRKIENKNIEADALELSKRNGRISYIEELLLLMKTAYEDKNKIKAKLNAQIKS